MMALNVFTDMGFFFVNSCKAGNWIRIVFMRIRIQWVSLVQIEIQANNVPDYPAGPEYSVVMFYLILNIYLFYFF